MTHTPEWSVDDTKHGYVYVLHGDRIIAECPFDGPGEHEQALAHARLIAAVPKLLEACRAVVADAIVDGKIGGDRRCRLCSTYLDEGHQPDCSMVVVEAILAKPDGA